MREVDYNIATLGPDDLYRLLPYIVRATDPNDSIRVIFNALTEFHNHAAEKLREMPRLQDPGQCGKFSPEDFGESQADYDAYLDLIYKQESGALSSGELGYMETLKTRLPQSLNAREMELKFLGLLSDTVGVKLLGRFVSGILRSWVKTGVLRSHISGTHSAIYVIGRVLGFIDLKVSELWSRFAIKDPGEPRATRNDSDFAYYPEEYPYNPLSDTYGNVEDLVKAYTREDGLGDSYNKEETLQLPYGSITYNPNILDDANFIYTVEFENVTHVTSSRLHYNLIVNNHNPFGNFTSLVDKKLKYGTYNLASGSNHTRASVSIPSDDGTTSFIFEAVAHGDWANSVTLTISNLISTSSICDESVDYDLLEAKQKMSLSGPQSKIKFKSSFFDLITAIDPIGFMLHYPAVNVTKNNSLKEIGEFSYSVDIVTNTLSAVVPSDVTSFVNSGDSVVITNSSSQYDDDSFLIDRNKNYKVLSVSLTSGETHVTLGMLEGENAAYDSNAYGRSKLDISSIEDDGSGKALLNFSDVVSTSNTAPVVIKNSFSGLYDGEYTVSDFDGLGNSLKLYDSGISGLVPFVSISTEYGSAFFQGNGYDDGVVPSGSGSQSLSGKLIKVYSVGQTAGAYPILGDIVGMESQADPSVNYQLNMRAYFELVAVVRQLVEDMKPVSRTMRRDINGIYFRDNINYAPLLVESAVVMESPSGIRYRLSVAKDFSIKWKVTTDATTIPVVQKDIDGKFYQWGITDLGVVTFTITTSSETTLVLFKAVEDDEYNAYVVVYDKGLIASSSTPEAAVETIHLRDGSESYLNDDIQNVVESIPEKVARYMGAAAFSTDAPSDNFVFQDAPEDDLSHVVINQDFSFGHVNTPMLNDVKLEWVGGKLVFATPIQLNAEGFSEGLWHHYFNSDDGESWHGAEFRGQDPRWDNRGIECGIVEPVPSSSSAGYGLDYNYPVWFLDHHNLYAWRDRVTNRPYISSYSHSSAASNMGPQRIDVGISYLDGPIEPVSGSGAFYHDIDIEYPWKKMKSRVFTPPQLNYTSLTNSGGKVRINFASTINTDDLYVGLKLFFSDESGYTGVYQILTIGDVYITISAVYVAGSTASDKSFWVKLIDFDLWHSSGNTCYTSIKPFDSGQLSGSVGYRVYVNSTSDLNLSGSAIVHSGNLHYSEDRTESFDPTDSIFVPSTQQKRTLMLCVKCGDGSFPIFAKLYQDASSGVLKNSEYEGGMAWHNSRDSLEVTLLTVSSTASVLLESPFVDTISSSHISRPSSTDENMTVEVVSPPRNIWRGGGFSTAFKATFFNGASGITLPLVSTESYYFTVYWGDGSHSVVTSWDDSGATHTYATNGNYQVTIVGTLPALKFEGSSSATKLKSIDQWGSGIWRSMSGAFAGCSNLISIASGGNFSSVTNFDHAWSFCSSLTSFPALNLSSGTSFVETWSYCSNLTSLPVLNLSLGTNFDYTWSGCSSLTSFPAIDLSSGVNFSNAWNGCSGLTSFPAINFASGVYFTSAWYGCSGLVSFLSTSFPVGEVFNGSWITCTSLTSFPAINFASGSDFSAAWSICSGLTSFPAIVTPVAANFNSAWYGCSGLTSFPTLDMSSAESFQNAWTGCTSLVTFSGNDMSSGVNFSNAWNGCSSLTSIGTCNVSSGTDFTSALSGCSTLTSCGLFGISADIDLSDTALDAAAFDTVFNSLATVSSKTITTRTSGIGSCDATIALSKGWTVIGYAPSCSVAPVATASSGEPANSGDTISVNTGTWDAVPTPVFTYSNNGYYGGVSSSVTVATFDSGNSIHFNVTATNSMGNTMVSSNSVTCA